MTALTTTLRAALAAALIAGTAFSACAQPFGGFGGGAAAGGGAAHVEEALTVMHQHFASADADHDGRITREQARAYMPFVFRNFDAIDTQHTGSVTMAQIEAYAARQGMARRGAR
jgi:hypothetical protein